MKIEPLDPQCGITGYSVGLAPTLIWAIREARLHNSANPSMIFNLKLDGRPFAGTLFSALLFFFIGGVDSVMFLLLLFLMHHNFDDHIH